jgi:tetratricopeptide (TPR) repeat protein
MNKTRLIWLGVCLPALSLPCFGQAMVEMGGTQASVMGLGAGLAASLNHGQAVKRSYQAAIKATNAATAQSAAISQYMKLGCDLEHQKKWPDAEESFKYVLRVIARRDGPGSPMSVPVLEHLVSVTQAQNKVNDAIGFQKTVLEFKKASHADDAVPVVNAQYNLSNLYEKQGDYSSAEQLLKECVQNQVKPEFKRKVTMSYVRVLRKLDKNSEADMVEKEEKAADSLPTDERTAKPETAVDDPSKLNIVPVDRNVSKANTPKQNQH